jgi:putative transposase
LLAQFISSCGGDPPEREGGGRIQGAAKAKIICCQEIRYRMLLTVKCKLVVNDEQKAALLRTMEQCNAACNRLSEIAFHDNDWNKFRLQKKCYVGIREDFGLRAQMAIRCISKVADTYKTDATLIKERNKRKRIGEPLEAMRQHKFKPHGAVAYDHRMWSWRDREHVSLSTLNGRVVVPILLRGKYADVDLKSIRKQADLLYLKKEFYLAIVIEIPDEPEFEPIDYIGGDTGRVNILATSDGKLYSGEQCEKTRKRYRRLKAALQSVGTPSARRKLQRVRHNERNFKKNTNHVISKDLVSLAKDTRRGIALEDLKRFAPEHPANKDQCDAHSKWSFFELRQFIEYKAKLVGVPVVFVNPAYTSQECSACGYIHENNRKTQSQFICLRCGHSEHADVNAAKTIRTRAAINRPIVATDDLKAGGLERGQLQAPSLEVG